jgi:hypothetical protein
MRGTPESDASVTAAEKWVAAVPEVHKAIAGSPVALPTPKAAKAAQRSSMNTSTDISERADRAKAKGVERDPGATYAYCTPSRIHSSTKVAQKVACALAVVSAVIFHHFFSGVNTCTLSCSRVTL